MNGLYGRGVRPSRGVAFLALAFECQKLGCHLLAVNLIGTIGDGLLQPGDALLINGGLVVQLVGCLLQALGFGAQLNAFAGRNAASIVLSAVFGLSRGRRRGIAVLHVAWPSAGRSGWIVGAVEIDNH